MSKAPQVARYAVASHRASSPLALDYFPTPPWATRALAEIVLPKLGIPLAPTSSVWEPAAGGGHMSEVLREYAGDVWASDVHRHPGAELDALGSFVGEGLDVVAAPEPLDWVITNPPFNLAEDFIIRGIEAAPRAAMLLRSNFIEGVGRFQRIFDKHPPLAMAQFAERVPMVAGRWDPDATTATAYAWFIFERGFAGDSRLIIIPPGQREALSRRADIKRFTRAQLEGADH